MASNKVDRKLPKENLVKVGRLKYTIAKKINRKTADIYYSKTNSHLEKHSAEVSTVGMTIFQYIKFVVENFNQIRKGQGDSLLLVVYNNNKDENSNTACIKLTMLTGDNYEISTVQPRRYKSLKNFETLWKKE